MDAQLSFYDILGVQSGASADDVQRSYDERIAVLAPGMISGAPSKVIAAADRARTMLDLARRTLTDAAARQLYDTEIGILRPGTGLARPASIPSEDGVDPIWNRADADGMVAAGLAFLADTFGPHPYRSRRVIVPDARGLFVGAARRVMTLYGLHTELVQMTLKPMPVEGLVVDQSVRPGSRLRRSSTVTALVWHPAQQRRPA